MQTVQHFFIAISEEHLWGIVWTCSNPKLQLYYSTDILPSRNEWWLEVYRRRWCQHAQTCSRTVSIDIGMMGIFKNHSFAQSLSFHTQKKDKNVKYSIFIWYSMKLITQISLSAQGRISGERHKSLSTSWWIYIPVNGLCPIQQLWTNPQQDDVSDA